MRVIVDAMGSDHAPEAQVEGALRALDSHQSLTILLAGPKGCLEAELRKHGAGTGDRLGILDAPQVIAPEEEPVQAIRSKKESSMVRSLRELGRGEAAAAVSAGNTGALLAGSLFICGRIRGVRRPALATVMPTLAGDGMLFLDLGASVDSRAGDLVQHAVMGAVYAREVMNRQVPRVALLNVGEERQKGNSLLREAHELLSEREDGDLEFVGNVEGRDLFQGDLDVVVADGFVGNVTLKVIEGTARALMDMIRSEIDGNLRHQLGGALLRPAFRSVYRRMDYTEYGGAPLLGLREAVIKCHGSSNARAVQNGIGQALFMAQRQVPQIIGSHLDRGAGDTSE